jgi:hypothetical protein
VSASVASWNHNNSASYHGTPHNDYAGGGSESAVYALANIKSFVSALNSTPTTPNPIRLAFANTSASGNTYGGGFNGSFMPVSCDFINDVDLSDSSHQLPAGGSFSNSSYTGSNTYYANGDIHIVGNVIYDSSGSRSLSTDIPRLKLVAIGGNIYISNNVEELDGMYVALPKGGVGGNIYTCQEGGTGSNPPVSTLLNSCTNKLKVYGAFLAKHIYLQRVAGTSLRDATPGDDWRNNNSAETFIFSPEMWIPNGSGVRNFNYDAILGLPPVL